MKKQVVYIQGGEAYTDYEDFLSELRHREIEDPLAEKAKRWHRSLQEDLGSEYEVYRPSMPNSENSKYLEWKIWFEKHFQFFRDDVVLIGHSQGGMFLSKYLIEQETPFSIRALFLVGSVHDCSERFYDSLEDGGDFVFDATRLSMLEERTEDIFIVHSQDDFVVPFEQGEKLARALPEAEFMVFEDKNHFLIEEFPELVEKIRGL